jgi:hypothetical protein
MDLPNPSLTGLFDQLGLASEETDIQKFIAEHQLDQDTKLIDAPFWTEQQRSFLKEEMHSDAEWAPIVDELNVALHPQNHT